MISEVSSELTDEVSGEVLFMTQQEYLQFDRTSPIHTPEYAWWPLTLPPTMVLTMTSLCCPPAP